MGISEATRTQILTDISRLQLAWSPAVFSKAASLLKKKWESEGVAEPFLKYMEQWMITSTNWYEGVAVRVPSTNNALESFNNVIKKEATLRKKLPLGRFIKVITQSIQNWSERMDFQSIPSISQKLWLAAYRFAKEGVEMEESLSDDGYINVLCPASGQSLTKKNKAALKYRNWKTYDRFLDSFHIYMVSFRNDDEWLSSTCTCPSFFKKYLCKHIVGMAILKKLAHVPAHIKSIKIGQKVKPGRPAKAKKALQRN